MAKVLGVTRAGYYAWKNRAPQRGKRALARRRLDEAVAWEHEVSGGTYGPPCVRHALARAGVDLGVRAVAATRGAFPAGVVLHADRGTQLDYRSRTWCLSSVFRLGLRAKVAVI